MEQVKKLTDTLLKIENLSYAIEINRNAEEIRIRGLGFDPQSAYTIFKKLRFFYNLVEALITLS